MNSNISKIAVFLITIMISMPLLFYSCTRNNKHELFFSKFQNHINLNGKSINIQTEEPSIFGTITPTTSGYILFQFSNNYLLAATNDNFDNYIQICKKGEGPDEFKGVSSSFGLPLIQGGLSVLDPYSHKFYSMDPRNGYAITEIIDFAQTPEPFLAPRVIQLKNGKYVGTKNDFTTGLESYDPATGKVSAWPSGLSSQPAQEDLYSMTSLRDIAYQPDKGIVAEIYGSYPTIILHDESGNIIRTLTYDGYKPMKKENNNLSDCFRSISLTPEYIWVLKGDSDLDEDFHIFVLDYEGNAVADLTILPTSVISVDPDRDRIIAVDPNEEERNIMVYPIPENLRK